MSDSRRPRPTLHEAALVLLLVVGLSVVLGYPLQSVSLIPGVLLTEWLLVLGPVVLVLRLRRIAPAPALRFSRPAWRTVVGATLAGASGWYVIGALTEQLQDRILPVPPEVLEAMRVLIAGSGRPLALDLLALAVSPAICEELLFRGFVLRATESEWPAAHSVAVNALLFGLFHLSVFRLLPTAALGLVLALIALRARSVLPAIVFHLLNNAMTLLVARYVDGGQGAGVELNPVHAALAVVVFAAGLALALWRDERGPSRPARRPGG